MTMEELRMATAAYSEWYEEVGSAGANDAEDAFVSGWEACLRAHQEDGEDE